jgi:hypothetical protein
MLWLALVFPDWPLQALFRNQAHAQPLAVADRQRMCWRWMQQLWLRACAPDRVWPTHWQ